MKSDQEEMKVLTKMIDKSIFYPPKKMLVIISRIPSCPDENNKPNINTIFYMEFLALTEVYSV